MSLAVTILWYLRKNSPTISVFETHIHLNSTGPLTITNVAAIRQWFIHPFFVEFPKRIIGIIAWQVCQFFMINEYAQKPIPKDGSQHRHESYLNNTDKATQKMFPGFYCGSMIAVFPVDTFSFFSLIVFLRRTAGNQLDWFRNGIPVTIIHNQQVNMVWSHCIIKNHQPVSFFCFKEPLRPSTPVFNEFKKELPFMASMR